MNWPSNPNESGESYTKGSIKSWQTTNISGKPTTNALVSISPLKLKSVRIIPSKYEINNPKLRLKSLFNRSIKHTIIKQVLFALPAVHSDFSQLFLDSLRVVHIHLLMLQDKNTSCG